MLLIKKTLKKVFKRVLFLIMLIELLLLIVILVIYQFNTIQVNSDMKENFKKNIINYRDLFNVYLKNKYLIMINDLILILKTYEEIESSKGNSNNYKFFLKYTDDYINTNCVVNGYTIENIPMYTDPWYTDLNTLDERQKGTWYNGKNKLTYKTLEAEDKNKLLNLCAMNNLMLNILMKNLKWKNIFDVNEDYFIFAFKNSFFYKYPMYYNAYMNPDWIDTERRSDCLTNRGINYDPKCRPYYIDALNDDSNITIVRPFKLASTSVYGSHICIKSLKKQIINNQTIPDILGCFIFNYNDLKLYQNQIDQLLGNNSLYIVYSKGEQLSIVYNTAYSPKDFRSFGKELNLNNNTENDFFEAYYQNIFQNYYESASNENKESYFKEIYKNIQNFYNEAIYKKLTKIIKNYTDDYNNQINMTNFFNYSEEVYNFSTNSSYEYINSTNSIEKTAEFFEDFYVFPIPISFDYTGDYQIEISQNLNSDFYLIYIKKLESSQKNVNLFYYIIIFEILLYFFFLIGLNFFIWIIFGVIYYYFSNGFFLPLKQINSLCREIFLMDKVYTIENDLVEETLDNQQSSSLSNSIKPMFTLIENKLTSWIYAIFRLNEYQEIHDCILTLKILKIIHTFKKITTKDIVLNYDLINNNAIENLIDSLFYLMHSIPSSKIGDLNMDCHLIALLIYNNFIYKLNSKAEEDEVKLFYEDISQIIDLVLSSKSASRKSSVSILRRASSFVKHIKNAISNSDKHNPEPLNQNIYIAEKEIKDTYNRLKENLQFKYCIFKIKLVRDENKFIDDGNIFDIDYNSDEETDKSFQKSKDNDNTPEMEEFWHENIRKKSQLKKKDDIKYKLKITDLVNQFDRYFSLAEANIESFNSLRQIAAHITQSSLLFEINNDREGLRQCISALEKIRNIGNKISKDGHLTKFTYLTISTLFFERILFLLSKISEKFDQKKTQFFIYLNMLDLGPVYDKGIRAHVLQKLLDYLNKTGLNLMKKSRNNSDSDIFEGTFYHTKIVRNKVRAILNMTKYYPKNILLMIDMNLPFLKDKNFVKILQTTIEKKRNFFYFSCFDHKLYIYRNLKKEESINDNNQYINSSVDEIEMVNLFRQRDNEKEQSENNEVDEEDYNNFKELRKFIKNYNKVENMLTKNLRHRADNAIKYAIKYHHFKEYPKNNNFLIIITSIEAGFSFKRDNLIEISKLLYESQYSLILCIIENEKMYTNERFKTKLECYKKFIERDIINGHLFIIKSYSILKYVLNCIFPNKFKEFDPFTLKTFLESLNFAFCEEISHNSLISPISKETLNFETDQII